MWQRRAQAKACLERRYGPELDNYDKKRHFEQCGKAGRVATWVRVANLYPLSG
jgi:hypothetical protein